MPDDPKFIACCGEWQDWLDKYQALAKSLNICIVPGTIVERHQDAPGDEYKLLNAAYFIDNHGDILGRYVKTNLWYLFRVLISLHTRRLRFKLRSKTTKGTRSALISPPLLMSPMSCTTRLSGLSVF